ncbi:hypothetical protein [Acidipila sp. EB88]|uniref:hypothetical protein n=1 Tax=Acidipila sp. EB88 TaxID=2305226 RepID=UPI000F5ED753|nr:hypothetical protein [Acidipila sp. EB88]
MKNDDILQAIDEELTRLRKVRNLLSGAPVDASWSPFSQVRAAKKRFLSDDARQRIADAQRRRWAAHRAKA